MQNVQFKAGDLVYCPSLGTEVFEIESMLVQGSEKSNTLRINGVVGFLEFNTEGVDVSSHLKYRLVFPANEENRKMLSELHGVEFRKYGHSNTIQSMLDDGYKFVVCYVGNYYNKDEDLIRKAEFDMVTSVEKAEPFDYFYTPTTNWDKAVPVDPKTGRVITSYSDGKMIFKD